MSYSPQILYQDNHLIAVNKVIGEIVQGDKTGDEPLSHKVAQYLKVAGSKPGDAFIGVIHRIDRPVSGVVLFAKTGKGLSKMNELFRLREIKKVYWALVEGKLKQKEGILIHYLSKNEEKNKSHAYDSPRDGYLKCELSFKTIQELENYSLIEVEPLTGRHHQIRVQLSANGNPIKGDVKYGARRANGDRGICLHARKLSFTHPVRKDFIEIVADVPTSWPIAK